MHFCDYMISLTLGNIQLQLNKVYWIVVYRMDSI